MHENVDKMPAGEVSDFFASAPTLLLTDNPAARMTTTLLTKTEREQYRCAFKEDGNLYNITTGTRIVPSMHQLAYVVLANEHIYAGENDFPHPKLAYTSETRSSIPDRAEESERVVLAGKLSFHELEFKKGEKKRNLWLTADSGNFFPSTTNLDLAKAFFSKKAGSHWNVKATHPYKARNVSTQGQTNTAFSTFLQQKQALRKTSTPDPRDSSSTQPKKRKASDELTR